MSQPTNQPSFIFESLIKRVDQLESTNREQGTSLAVVCERLESVVKQLDLSINMLTTSQQTLIDSNSKLADRIEKVDIKTQTSEDRIGKIEERFKLKDKRNTFLYKILYSLGLTGATVIVTRFVEIWLAAHGH